MRTPSLYAPLAVSVFFHCTIAIVGILLISYPHTRKAAVSYTISLTDDFGSPAPSSLSASQETPAPVPSVPKPPVPQKTEKKISEKPVQKPAKADRAKDEQNMQDRIDAIKAKKRIEKMAALRKVVDVDSASAKAVPKPGKSGAPGATGKGPSGSDYYAMVVAKMRQQWVFPENTDHDLETVVSIRIARDGAVTVQKIEKKSGNALFDRSVLRAITLASPLPPPKEEMEIGVRFHP